MATLMTQDKLVKIWNDSAKAKARSVKHDGNLYAAFCSFANDNSLDGDAFTQRTKSLEETLQRETTGEAGKKAVRSTSSSARSVIASALEQGRSVVREGKPVGKTRLEQEKKACIAGFKPENVVGASTVALKGMAVDTDDVKVEKAMSLADSLKVLCGSASEGVLDDIAHEILGVDERLTAALKSALQPQALPLAA